MVPALVVPAALPHAFPSDASCSAAPALHHAEIAASPRMYGNHSSIDAALQGPRPTMHGVRGRLRPSMAAIHGLRGPLSAIHGLRGPLAAIHGLRGTRAPAHRTRAPAHRPLSAIHGLRGTRTPVRRTRAPVRRTRAPAHRPLSAIHGLRGTRTPVRRIWVAARWPRGTASRVGVCARVLSMEIRWSHPCPTR